MTSLSCMTWCCSCAPRICALERDLTAYTSSSRVAAREGRRGEERRGEGLGLKKESVSGERGRSGGEKSLRNGVHHAGAVVWGTVYRKSEPSRARRAAHRGRPFRTRRRPGPLSPRSRSCSRRPSSSCHRYRRVIRLIHRLDLSSKASRRIRSPRPGRESLAAVRGARRNRRGLG
eukprot:31309-Pelagococcus_subviridis.AAC.4